MKTCIITGCGKPVRARGWCCMHWSRWRKTGTTDAAEKKYKSDVCKIDGCGKSRKSLGLCEMHYYRQRRNGKVGKAEPFLLRGHTGRPCKIEGCNKPIKTKMMCSMHYARMSRTGHTRRLRRAGYTVDARGYHIITVDGKASLLHRHVMAEHLGRKLKRSEVVHHIDRDPSNNDISNLMLLESNSAHQKLHWKEDRVKRCDAIRKGNANQPNAKGYYWNKRSEKWQAKIGVGGKYKFLGSFDTEDEAHQSYLDAKEKYQCYYGPNLPLPPARKVKGYSWDKRKRKWIARLYRDGKVKRLGSFDNEAEARQAYLDAKRKYHKIKDRTDQ